MLALPIMSEFPYASLLERSGSCSKKSFAQQESQQLQQSLRSSQLNTSNVGGHIEWKPEHFPHKMYDLLEDVERKGLDDIVSWLPDGKSFKIHSQIGFEQSIMPLYFSGMSSYKSFRRQLNLYGIYQHRHRPNQDANAYSHELLIRGQRHLCDKIARKKTNPPNKNKAGSSSSKSNNSADKSSTNNKKRNRSSLLAMIDQQNLKNASEPQVGQQDPIRMTMPSSTKSNNSVDIHSNMLMKAMYDDVTTQPNPVDINNIGKANKNPFAFNRTVDNNNVFQSFMGQYWDDLPNNMSSAQVVDEIIATFQQR
jgi:hypothetical protein